MNLREFGDYYNDFVASGFGGIKEDPYYSDVSLLGKGTNWQDAIFQTAFQQQHQVSAQGGTEKIQYYVSAGYMNQEGTFIASSSTFALAKLLITCFFVQPRFSAQ